MKVLNAVAAFQGALLAHVATAADPSPERNGWIGTCHDQGCDDCTTAINANTNKLRPRVNGGCTFHPTSDLTTEAGRQIKASDTKVCNTQGGCTLTASTTLTIGESINPSITGNFFNIISAAVGYTFTESMAYAVSTAYSQSQGTTGYVSYSPTLNCWDGTFSGCYETVGNDIYLIDESMSFHACTPARRDTQLDGVFSFVYEN